uniref:Putative ovule protein n=1 Tax=Solanum chacoense TaxID=4108 RepID=A0A0V0HDR1_SOLCH
MVAPKEIKRSETTSTTSQLSKAHLHPFKSSTIPLFQSDPQKSKRSNMPSLVPSSPSYTIPAEDQRFNGFWHNPRNTKPTKNIPP